MTAWDDLQIPDDVSDEQKAAVERQLAEATLFRVCFETDAGQRVLDVLRRELRRPVATGHREETPVKIGIRQGRVDIVQEILARIEVAKHGRGQAAD